MITWSLPGSDIALCEQLRQTPCHDKHVRLRPRLPGGSYPDGLAGQEPSTFTKTVYGSSALIASWTRGSLAWPRSSKKKT